MRLMEVTGFWFFIAGLCGFYCLMRRAGIFAFPAALGVLFVVVIPMNLKHLTTIYVDLALASLCVLAIHFLVQALFEKQWKMWIMFALAVGWLPAIKYTGLLFTASLAIVAPMGRFACL